jgi:hypothetical protein
MRKVDCHILELFQDKKEMSFGEIFRTLRNRGNIHYQSDISNSLKRLVKRGNLAKLSEDSSHPRYKLLEDSQGSHPEVQVNVKVEKPLRDEKNDKETNKPKN